MNTVRNVALVIFLTLSASIICEDDKAKKTVVYYGNEEFSNQDLLEIKKVLNPVFALQEGNFGKAFTLIFTSKIHDVLSSISCKNDNKNNK